MTEFRCPECSSVINYEHAVETRDADETVEGVRCDSCGFVVTPPEFQGTLSFSGMGDDKPTRIGHFVLERPLGRGAFGEVWLAEDVHLARKVALKLAVPRRGEEADLVHEAQAAASLRHPNIVAVHEVGREGEHVFIASEYVAGMTLKDKLTQGRPKDEEALRILATVARALHHAHQHDIVHRDVKPANILLDEAGVPYVADFGIAKRISAEATISSDGQVVGTVLYMSPEQASGLSRETDHRADVYAIGVILFEMLTGHLPFRGNVRALLHQKVYEEAPSPRTLRPTLPRDLETICLRCLVREPGRRYDSAEAVALELDRAHRGEPIEARPITSVERVWRWCRRRPHVASLIAALFLSLTTGLAGVSYFWWQSARHATRAEQHARRTGESLYRSQTKLASEYLEAGDLNGVRSVIDRFADGQPFADLRGFEWRYFDRATRRCHEVASLGDFVDAVAISLDGEFCAASTQDGRIDVWETRTGERVRTLLVERGDVRSIAFSPTRNQLAAGCGDGFVRIWNPITSGRTQVTLRHGRPVERVRFSPDGTRVLTMANLGAIRIWNIADEEPVATIASGKDASPRDAAFSPDGDRLAVVTDDDILRVWRIGERPPLLVRDDEDYTERIAWSPDGTRVVTASTAGRIRVRTAADGTVLAEVQMPERIGDVAFPTHDRVLALTIDNRLRIYDVTAGHEIGRVVVHNLGFGTMAVSADDRRIVVGSGDGSIRTLEVRDVLDREVHWYDAAVRTIALLDDGRFVAADGKGNATVRELVTGADVEPPATTAGKGGLVLVPGPTTSLLGSDGAVVHRLDVKGMGATAAALSPDDRLLAVVRSGPIRVREVSDGLPVLFEIPAREAKPEALVFLPARDDTPMELVASYADGVIQRYSVDDGEPLGEPITIDAVPRAMTSCGNGGCLAIGSSLGVVHVWNRASGELRGAFKAHAGPINAIVTLPNGSTVATGGRDKAFVLSDVDALEPIARLTGHDRQVFAIAVSADGRTILTGGLAGDVRVWQTEE